MKKTLSIVSSAYRAIVEEQDDTIIWINHAMKGAGAELTVLLKDNAVNVALAPGDGLLLEKVCYDKYNSLTNNKKSEIMIKLVK